MKPQQQLRKTPDGDCLRAVVATLLEYPIDKVPDFVQAPEVPDCPYPGWWICLQGWLNERGLWFLEVQLVNNFPWNPLPNAALCIFFGETRNGLRHAIVGRVNDDRFEPVFNPFPESGPIQNIIGLGFLIPRDPALTIKLGKTMEKIEKLAKNLAGPIGEAILEQSQKALNHEPENIIFLPSEAKE